eukprot:CAMPEP_0198284076 /NCGR_PEP_ID=MMETSP1449-20131203/3602_1 /TAXON_ID=420275 /ORGANISM="Attheya septentrionalis, Strain CCMP2084" /LENGTH=488 /DNA_ID=CAMNT_0043980991 /DNA_START=72 /DNA_END=1538 /DNA_ORIENTATION=+
MRYSVASLVFLLSSGVPSEAFVPSCSNGLTTSFASKARPSLSTAKYIKNAVQPLQSSAIPSTKPISEDLSLAEGYESSLGSSEPPSSKYSGAAQWHRERRKKMLQKYGDKIAPLEREASSQKVALPLLILGNASLLGMALWSGLANLHPLAILALAIFPGSMFSLWQLQILHDCLHGSLFEKGQSRVFGMPRKKLQDRVLFWGSMPSAFGYYLYLKYGHLTHHQNVGDPSRGATLAQLFDSDKAEFEDGDILFVAHRMKLKGEIGPRFKIPAFPSFFRQTKKRNEPLEIKMSISKSGFNAWKEGQPIRNVLVFASSFMFERIMLVMNDVVVALSGRNFFFPNKPDQFHRECANHCRCAVLLRAALWAVAGFKSLLFLYLAETVWSLPPIPAAAMFVTNHGSAQDPSDGSCIPSSSTYAGRWYSLYTLGTNYHCEHHDFPTIPLHKLGQLRKIAPEFYKTTSNDNLFRIMKGAFSSPDFYACMDAGLAG